MTWPNLSFTPYSGPIGTDHSVENGHVDPRGIIRNSHSGSGGCREGRGKVRDIFGRKQGRIGSTNPFCGDVRQRLSGVTLPSAINRGSDPR